MRFNIGAKPKIRYNNTRTMNESFFWLDNDADFASGFHRLTTALNTTPAAFGFYDKKIFSAFARNFLVHTKTPQFLAAFFMFIKI